MMKYILTLLTGLFLLVQGVFANSYSYFYIEGDKQTPFYVKMEGQMVPRLGKNYCIIPNLDAGVTYIEILFQQNKYPAQKFALKVPAGGSRGFLLQKVNDRQFALYDIQQGTYLVAGNKPEEDELAPAAVQTAQTPVAAADEPVIEDNAIPAFEAPQKAKKEKTAKPKKEVVVKEQPVTANDRFISDIELNRGNSGTAVPAPRPGAKPVKKKPAKRDNEEQNLAAVTDETDDVPAKVKQAAVVDEDSGDTPAAGNADCRGPMSTEEFEDFAIRILDKTEDDERIKVLTKGKGKKCFTTEQVRIIANNLATQSGRYDVVKLLYPQTSDKENYAKLESLFKTNYLKGKFREVIAPK